MVGSEFRGFFLTTDLWVHSIRGSVCHLPVRTVFPRSDRLSGSSFCRSRVFHNCHGGSTVVQELIIVTGGKRSSVAHSL